MVKRHMVNKPSKEQRDALIEAAQDRLSKITPGPWQPDKSHINHEYDRVYTGCGNKRVLVADIYECAANAHFVANAPADYIAFLAEIAQLKNEVKHAEARADDAVRIKRVAHAKTRELIAQLRREIEEK